VRPPAVVKRVWEHLHTPKKAITSPFLSFFFLEALEFKLRAYTFARQALLLLESLNQPFFVLGFFEVGSCLSWL
jgi:predicted N-acyltransferase